MQALNLRKLTVSASPKVKCLNAALYHKFDNWRRGYISNSFLLCLLVQSSNGNTRCHSGILIIAFEQVNVSWENGICFLFRVTNKYLTAGYPFTCSRAGTVIKRFNSDCEGFSMFLVAGRTH